MSHLRYAALGDSITVGLGDPMPDHSWRGWAAILAGSLAAPGAVEFHNLAESGALAHTAFERQLPAALALRPCVASVVVGVNDTLRGSFDLVRIGRSMDQMVGELTASGAVVLTARLPDPGRMLHLPGALARPLARRVRAINRVVDAVSARHASVHFDAFGHPASYDRRMWSVDRLHPSERGHRFLACEFADLLAARGFPLHGRPEMEPTNPAPTRAAQFAWMATKGTKWIMRRSTDLVPALCALAAAESWYGLRGAVMRVDQQLAADLELALDALPGTDSQLTLADTILG